MTTTQIPSTQQHTVTTGSAQVRQSVLMPGIVASLVAAATTTTLAAVASAAGVSFAGQDGAGIPIAGFATLTVFFSLIGVGLAVVLARTSRHPRSTFVRTTLVLLALSYVPDLVAGFDATSAATLIALHTVAALIVIPALAKRLAVAR